MSFRFVCLDSSKLANPGELYEHKWLEDLFGFRFEVEAVSSENTLDDTRQLNVLYNHCELRKQLEWLHALRDAGRIFRLIHVSDEHGVAPIYMYDWPCVKGVIRTYDRLDLPKISNLIVVPLGYHWKPTAQPYPRQYAWSFAGSRFIRSYNPVTNTVKEYDRAKDMKHLEDIGPHKLYWVEHWSDPSKLGESEYLEILQNSTFVACPVGQNPETYRLYEALEAGCIPVVPGEHGAKVIKYLLSDPVRLNEYRQCILDKWAAIKQELRQKLNA